MTTSTTHLPENFPRRQLMSGLSGAVSKFSARLTTDGKYSTFVSDEEHLQAYENCEEAARQLRDYMLRKARENPNWTHVFNLERTHKGILQKVDSRECDFTPSEIVWMMDRIKILLIEHGWEDLAI